MAKSDLDETLERLRTGLEGPGEPDLITVRAILRGIAHRNRTRQQNREYEEIRSVFRSCLDDRSRRLRVEIKTRLGVWRDALDHNHIPEENPRADVGENLKELCSLVPMDDEIDGLMSQMKSLSQQADDLAIYLAAEKEVQRLWNLAADIEQEKEFVSDRVIHRLQEALTHIEGIEKNTAIKTRSVQLQIEALHELAKRKVVEAANRYSRPTTLEAGEEFVSLVLDLVRRNKENPDQIVNYFESDAGDAIAINQKVSRAVEISKRRIVKFFWVPKVEGYLKEARQMLDKNGEHFDPFGAQRELVRCDELPGLGNEEIGRGLPDLWKGRIGDLKAEADTAAETRRAAMELCRQAATRPSLQEAWSLLQQAAKLDARTPDLERTQHEILVRGHASLEEQIKRAKQRIDIGDWDGAARVLDDARSVMGLDREFCVESVNIAIQEMASLVDDVKKTRAQLTNEQLTLEDRQRMLEQFKDRYGDARFAAWPDLVGLAKLIGNRLHISDSLINWQALARPGATVEELEPALIECQQLFDEAADKSNSIPTIHRNQLEDVRRALRAWLGCAKAKMRGKSLSEALEDLSPSLAYPGTQQIAEEIEKSIRRKAIDTQVTDQAIIDIKGSMAENPEKAFHLAEHWLKQDTLQEPIFRALREDAQEHWKTSVTNEIQDLLKSGPDGKGARRIRDVLLGKLKDIDSDLHDEYAERVELPCLEAEANERQKDGPPKGTTPWNQIVQAWRKAATAARNVGNEDKASEFERNRICARKAEARAEVLGKPALERIDLFKKLAAELGTSDAEPWLWLAEENLAYAESVPEET